MLGMKGRPHMFFPLCFACMWQSNKSLQKKKRGQPAASRILLQQESTNTNDNTEQTFPSRSSAQFNRKDTWQHLGHKWAKNEDGILQLMGSMINP